MSDRHNFLVLPALTVCVEQRTIKIIIKVNLRGSELSQTLSLTNTKPIWYVTITIITLGCPFNDFKYGQKYLRKLI